MMGATLQKDIHEAIWHYQLLLLALLQKLVSDVFLIFHWEILRDICQEFCRRFFEPQKKGSKFFGANFGALFVRKFVAQTIFRKS